jgi:hypothetical protein
MVKHMNKIREIKAAFEKYVDFHSFMTLVVMYSIAIFTAILGICDGIFWELVISVVVACIVSMKLVYDLKVRSAEEAELEFEFDKFRYRLDELKFKFEHGKLSYDVFELEFEFEFDKFKSKFDELRFDELRPNDIRFYEFDFKLDESKLNELKLKFGELESSYNEKLNLLG